MKQDKATWSTCDWSLVSCYPP